MAEKDDDFDPYKARVVPAPVSNIGTLLHFLKGSVGTGILAMPKGFVYTGLIFGSVFTIFIGAICSYGLNLLMSTEYLLCKRKRVAYLNYSEAMQYAMEIGPERLRIFAKTSGILVNAFLLSYQLGICCVYMIFVSTNVKKVVDMSYDSPFEIRTYMTIFFVLFLIINFVPDLKKFAPLSLVANLMMFFGLGIILYYVFDDMAPIEERDYFGSPSKWVMFIGICLFAIESVGVVVSAEYSMKNPQDFCGFWGVLNVSLMIVTLLYWFLGFFGYWKFGDCAAGSITLNMPDKNMWSAATQGLFAGALVISYGLQCYPAIEIVWNNYLLPRFEDYSEKKKMLYQYILRTVLTLFTFCLAQAFANHLANAISFIGVVCLSMLGFAFPGLMNLCYRYPDQYGKWNWAYYKNVCMFFLGVFLLIAGFYVSIEDIVSVPAIADHCLAPILVGNSTSP